MSFAWPFALLLVLAVPVVLGCTWSRLRRRRRQAITYSSVALLRAAVPRTDALAPPRARGRAARRLGVLAMASARPELTTDVPAQKTSIILALDESGSMCSTDLLPNRLAVAQRAALQFVNSEPSGTQIGLVLFNGFAELAVPPTTDRGALDHALDNLTTGPGTAIGAAILQSLDAIAEVDPQVKPVANSVLGADGHSVRSSGSERIRRLDQRHDGHRSEAGIRRLCPRHHRPADRRRQQPGDHAAAGRPVRGRPTGPHLHDRLRHDDTRARSSALPSSRAASALAVASVAEASAAGASAAAASAAEASAEVRATHSWPTCRRCKRSRGLTGGKSYTARTASQLTKVFADLSKEVSVQKEHDEVTAEFAIIGALLALAAFAASIRWGAYP